MTCADNQGLKPALYHTHKSELLSAGRDELPAIVDDLVQEQNLNAPLLALDLEKVTAPDMWTLATQVDEAIALDLGQTLQTGKRRFEAPPTWVTVRVAEVSKSYKGPRIVPLSAGEHPEALFAIPCPRAEPKAYIAALRELHSYVAASSGATLLAIATESDLVAETRRPLTRAARLDPAALCEARKVIIPVAVTLMCCSDDGVDKSVIASELHRLVALWPNGNPSRAALKRVNDFFMSEQY